MSLQRSTDDLVSLGNNLPNCGVCANAITNSSYLYKSTCGHSFHKSCFQKHMKQKQICPICNTKLNLIATPSAPPPPIVTRSQAQRAQEFNVNRVDPSFPLKSAQNQAITPNYSVMSSSFPQEQREHIRNVVTAAVGAQQAEMLTSLSQQLTKIIENNIEAGFRRLSLNTSTQSETSNRNPNPRITVGNIGSQVPVLPPVEGQTLEQLLGLPSNVARNQNSTNHTGNINLNTSGSLDSSLRSDKVGHVIHNWKVRFSGDAKGMAVDNFIYREEALTHQTLNGNFDLLCRHISTLFDAKASEWFWRYHRSVSEIRWADLCTALRHQYKDSRKDVDFREMIRDRKQLPGENFDSFYESIVDISDRLSTPLPENILVEILRRNLLPEIQHEILNIPVYSVSHLRDICRRREFFLLDMGRKQAANKVFFSRRQVHEIVENGVELTEETGVSALALMCWNCQKVGHRYQDCLEERRIFCYGCGTPDTYKPNCSNCNNS